MNTFVERFWANVIPEPNSGCWLWAAHLVRGYGQIQVGKTDSGKKIQKLAHVVSWQIHNGPVPAGLQLDHLCRVRSCVNPRHLEPVTPGENIRRGLSGYATGARKRAQTHCKRGHEFTPENTLHNGVKPHYRNCRICDNETHKLAKRKRRGSALPHSRAVQE